MATKTVKIVRKNTKTVAPAANTKAKRVAAQDRATKRNSTKRFKVGGEMLPLNKAVNIKVAGERVMRKNVVLVPSPSVPGAVLVRTGRRGRPAVLPVEQIEKFRVL
jgi:hypothetical protein